MTSTTTSTVFDLAAKVFEGWTDPDTGLRVLKVHTRGLDEGGQVWATLYHQCQCFLDGGRKIVVRPEKYTRKGCQVLDLTTGEMTLPLPISVGVNDVNDRTKLAAVHVWKDGERRSGIWDLTTQQELVSLPHEEGWHTSTINFLADGRRAVVFRHQGRPYGEVVRSQYVMLEPGQSNRVILELNEHFCSHFVACPTDPELYAYDRWPSPERIIDQAIHIRTVDGKFEEPLKLLPDTLRSPDMWGARDHYMWTPDGRWIVSYLYPHPVPKQGDFNHFEFEWYLSATDWRTGEDRCAKYPPGRWGGHMGVSPDSKQILCAGGPGYDKLFLVDIDKLKHGWNEHVLCSYPTTVSTGKNSDPFPHPYALPDQSGVIFHAGWPGPEHGLYLVEWPKD